MSQRRNGFTLMELLVVISIIAVLGGLLLPAMGMVKKQVNAVKCSNNLSQLAKILEIYRQEHDDRFPAHLIALIDTAYEISPKSLLCPFDTSIGSDELLGRDPVNWGNLSRLHEFDTVKNRGSSYCYEASSNLGANWYNNKQMLEAGDISYFWRNLDPAKQPAVGTVSWMDGKLNQQRLGNLKPGVMNPTGNFNEFGAPFPSANVPIIRCYWHADWAGMKAVDKEIRNQVNNVTLGFNVVWSTPYWERDVNPKIPK